MPSQPNPPPINPDPTDPDPIYHPPAPVPCSAAILAENESLRKTVLGLTERKADAISNAEKIAELGGK